MYRQHIAATTSGMELMSGGSKRLPCNVESDETGNWILICEGLVVVFLTETCHRLLSSVKRGRERSGARALAQSGGARDPSVLEVLLAELKQENAHLKREEGDQV